MASGGLNVGTLYASLTASTAGWQKGLNSALKSVEAFAKQVKRISTEVASAGAAMSALGGAAIALASQVDGPTKQAVDGLKKSTQLLAVQVADMLLPALKALSEMMKSAASFVAGLSPHTKEMIANFAVVAVQVAGAAKAFSVLASLGGNAVGIIRAVVLAAGPLLVVAAALALVAGAVALVHRAWRKNWGGIQEATAEVLEWLRKSFSTYASFMGKMWDFLVDGAKAFVDGLLAVGDVLERVTGKQLGVSGLREGFSGLWKDLKSGSFFSESFEFGKSVGASLVDGIKEEWSALKSELGLDNLMRGGTPIGLGRGMGPRASTSSGMDGVAAMALSAQEEAAARALKDITDEATRFKASLRSVDAQQEVRRWLRELGNGPSADGVSAGRLGMSTAARSGMGGGGVFATAQAAIDAGAKDAAARLKRAGATMAGILGASTGALGRTIGNIASAASQGGPWAALLAAVMEVFTRMQSFQKLLGVFEFGLVRLGQFLEPLLSGLFDVVGTITAVATEMLAPIFKALKPLFDGITKFATNLIPVVSAVGNIFEGLAPIIEVVGRVVGGILEALSPVLDLITGVIKGIATVLLGIMIAINEIAAAFGDTKAKAEADRMRGLVDKMWAPAANELAIAEGNAARAAWENASAQSDAAKSAEKATASLSNVPSGYRVALARFNADMGIGGGGYSPAGAAAGGNTTIVINGDITTDADTIEQLGEDARREAIRERGQRTGNPSRGRRGGGYDP